eukprot:scaffold228_cov312-Pinguiococcus_pyrenoidosus.AAC.9
MPSLTDARCSHDEQTREMLKSIAGQEPDQKVDDVCSRISLRTRRTQKKSSQPSSGISGRRVEAPREEASPGPAKVPSVCRPSAPSARGRCRAAVPGAFLCGSLPASRAWWKPSFASIRIPSPPRVSLGLALP